VKCGHPRKLGWPFLPCVLLDGSSPRSSPSAVSEGRPRVHCASWWTPPKATLAVTCTMRSDLPTDRRAQPSGPHVRRKPASGGPPTRGAKRARRAILCRVPAGQPKPDGCQWLCGAFGVTMQFVLALKFARLWATWRERVSRRPVASRRKERERHCPYRCAVHPGESCNCASCVPLTDRLIV